MLKEMHWQHLNELLQLVLRYTYFLTRIWYCKQIYCEEIFKSKSMKTLSRNHFVVFNNYKNWYVKTWYNMQISCFLPENRISTKLQTSPAKITGTTVTQVIVCIGKKRLLLLWSDEMWQDTEEIIPKRVKITYIDNTLMSYKDMDYK